MSKFHLDGTLPQLKEVFVFGSNLAGIHGAGAAKVAREKFGAKLKFGFGYQSNPGGYMSGEHCYAIPTKDHQIKTLPLEEVKKYIELFVEHTHASPSQFFVTRVGCGLAGFKDSEIAPLFKGCANNVSFPQNWKPYL